ncbi:hypothetical protein LTR91_025073 [Friedmanniomyces endolithicus]|uniref:Uncharacterized protein n=1 Tax=Friedmanniomyces endolithicus TaxID=329885 RepID=A0AAN6H0E1_9PEZI|nr:hypothetical protein LTR75_016764 [Friedmanniomyces endolithicus]KAK0827565.1 hypothetical protein LTR03_016841 [Friedmanniomyces endolithicus]KAK0951298.1 hypothetical protein LTR91_025073 [Friedmanniomyces endolithicus]KAK0955758.1 hypothetical protein LTS01_023192 [Friedmanniomyces endolithicus]KAK1021721.1 hypothetical protein LTS16_026303 [Friedmanniomyces endolithicus]
MPHQSDRDLPKSSPASDHDSADSVTTTTDQQPIMTPGTTAPKSETYVTDAESGDLDRFAALYANLAMNYDGHWSHYNKFLAEGMRLERKKMEEVARIKELLVMARQFSGTIKGLDYATFGESAVGASGDDSATTSATPNYPLQAAETTEARLHSLREQVVAQNGDIESLRHQLAARTIEIENLQARQAESNKRMAAHGDEMHSLRNQLATRQPPTNEGVARLLSLSNRFMEHGRFNDCFLDYLAAEKKRLNILVAWQVWVSVMLAWLCLMLAWLSYKISAAP